MSEGGNYCRVNKDSLRSMLHFSKFTPENEGVVNDIEIEIVRKLLAKGKNVIIDDTNLTKKHEQRWEGVANECNSRFNVHVMKTPMEECIVRDKNRENSVGEQVIKELAFVWGKYPISKLVICDLDGTLCNLKHRVRYLDDGDWKSFYSLIHADTLKEETRDAVLDIINDYDNHKVVFVSGRPETYRKETEDWLKKNVPELMTEENFACLFMRREHDKRSDVEVKQQIYDKYLSKYTITHSFDDRGRVIDGVWKPLEKEGKIGKVVEVDRWDEDEKLEWSLPEEDYQKLLNFLDNSIDNINKKGFNLVENALVSDVTEAMSRYEQKRYPLGE